MAIGITQDDIDRVLGKVRQRLLPEKSSLIPGLQVIQGELGYLPQEAMKGLSDYIRVRESEIWGTASFYAQFRFTPIGKHKVTVCRGTACHVRGSANILRELERELGIKAGGTTEDLMFSLEEVACVGSCAIAPVQIIDERFFGRMTSVKIKKQLAKLRGEKPGAAKEEKEEEPAEEKVAPAEEKPPVKEKAAPKKIVVAKKRAAPKKKAKAVKKAVKRKKAAAKRKASAKKSVKKRKAAPKKKAKAVKKAVRKKKAAAKRKASAKKSVRKRKAAVKKKARTVKKAAGRKRGAAKRKASARKRAVTRKKSAKGRRK